MAWPVSLFTAGTPWLPLAELIPRAAAAGYQGLDLAAKPRRWDPARAPDCWQNNAALLDLDRLDEEAAATAAALAAHGLACRVLCSYVQADDPAAPRLARAARTLGAPLARIWTPAPQPGRAAQQVAEARAQWRDLAAIAAAHGCRFVLELHDRTITTGASAALRLIDGLDPAHVGVILDVANAAREGNEPLPMAIDLLGPYLAHVQVKDLAWRPAETWNGLDAGFAPLGQGAIRWPLCLRQLRQAGYAGWLAIENFTALDRGVDRIAEDLRWLRACVEASHP